MASNDEPDYKALFLKAEEEREQERERNRQTTLEEFIVKDVARRRGLQVRKCDRTGKGG